MGQEYQNSVLELVAKHGKENLLVMLGLLDEELVEIYAITFTQGDPSGIGPLTGVELRLPIYHILEPEVKSQIPESVYQDQMGLMEITAGPEKIQKITELLKKARAA